MKINKRKAMFVLILIMIPLLAFYGCGGNDNDDEEIVDESPGQDEEIDEEEEGNEEGETDEEEETNGEEEETVEDRDLETLFGSMEYPVNFSYEMTMESQEMGSYTTQIWIIDEKMRSEGEWEGQTFITIMDEEYYYTLDPSAMTAMRFPIEDNVPMEEDFEEEPRIDEFMIEEDWENLTYLGEETLDGVKTYVIIDQSDEEEYKMWIHQEYGIPMRMESSGPSPEDDYVMEVRNLVVGEVKEGDFEIPDEYEILDFGF